MKRKEPTDENDIQIQERWEWAKIQFFQFEKPEGETFLATNKVIQVDGWTDPCEEHRMCLGFRGFINTTHEIETIRRAIGNGIELSYDNENLIIKNLSDISVFVSSPQLNNLFSSNFLPEDPIKISSCHEAQIFSLERLKEKIEKKKLDGFKDVFNLKDDCIIRIGFAKGWGLKYKRKMYTNIPCWIEISMCEGLRKVSETLRSLEPPQYNITSSDSSDE